MTYAQQKAVEFAEKFGGPINYEPTTPSLKAHYVVLNPLLHVLKELHATIEPARLGMLLAQLELQVNAVAVAAGIDLQPFIAAHHQHRMGLSWTTEQMSNFTPEVEDAPVQFAPLPDWDFDEDGKPLRLWVCTNREGNLLMPPGQEMPDYAKLIQDQKFTL